MKQAQLLFFLFFLLSLNSCAQEPRELKIIDPNELEASRKVRLAGLNDPIRPTWHLTIPEGKGYPFDPNGAIYKDGIYHLWYLYQVNGVHHWQIPQ